MKALSLLGAIIAALSMAFLPWYGSVACSFYLLFCAAAWSKELMK